jgi:hypothetical protein
MRIPSSAGRRARLALALCAALGALDAGRAEEAEAVSSQASADYVRTRRPDGTFQPEGYVFGKGGYAGSDRNDKSIDKMGFLDVAHVIAVPLARQNYIPAKDPAATQLIIMVYWGTTRAPENASGSQAYQNLESAHAAVGQLPTNSMGQSQVPTDPAQLAKFEAESAALMAVLAENRMRDNADRRTALLLGYNSWWAETIDAPKGTPLELRKRDMMAELEEDRYYVILMAYDFQLLWKEKKHKLLWETRFSVDEHHREFDRDLGAMAQFAAQYFGQDSNGLTHGKLPQGDVEIGEIKSLGAVPEK